MGTAMTEPKDWETKCQDLLSACSILDVLAIQLAVFEHKYGTGPEIILMARSLKGSLIREVYQKHGLEPADTVIEPVWVNKYPLFFQPLKEDYLVLRNNRTGKELTL